MKYWSSPGILKVVYTLPFLSLTYIRVPDRTELRQGGRIMFLWQRDYYDFVTVDLKSVGLDALTTMTFNISSVVD